MLHLILLDIVGVRHRSLAGIFAVLYLPLLLRFLAPLRFRALCDSLVGGDNTWIRVLQHKFTQLEALDLHGLDELLQIKDPLWHLRASACLVNELIIEHTDHVQTISLLWHTEARSPQHHIDYIIAELVGILDQPIQIALAC